MPHFQKGSKEAKEYMASLRAKKGKSKGGAIAWNQEALDYANKNKNLQDIFNKKPAGGMRTMDYDPMKHFEDDHKLLYHNADGTSKQFNPFPINGGMGLGAGVVEIHHHHHHHHMNGEGMWDWIDPNKNGVANAFDPKKNGVANLYYQGVYGIKHLAGSADDLRKQVERVGREKLANVVNTARDQAIEASRNLGKTFNPALGNQIVGGLKVAGHYAIPAITGAIGSTLGELASGGNPIAGFAGNQAGKMAGQQINKAIGIGIRRRRGRPRKGEGMYA